MPTPGGKKFRILKGVSQKSEMLNLFNEGGFRIDRPTFERVMGGTVFGMMMQGEIIPLHRLAARLRKSYADFWRRKDITRFAVGKVVYVTATEANRIEAEVKQVRQEELKANRRAKRRMWAAKRAKRKRFEKKLPEEQAAVIRAEQERSRKVEERRQAAEESGRNGVERRIAVERAKKIKAAEEAQARKQAAEARQPITDWKKVVSRMPEGGKKKIMMGLLSRSANLSPEQFKSQVEPALKRLRGG